MLGRDIDTSIIQYRTWISEGQPDFDGYSYTGPKAGEHALVDICAYLIDDSVVADFNLPLPLSWKSTKHVLPDSMDSSQLCVVDGYVYLFGSKISNRIFRASVSDPCIWEDTGKTLPTSLYASQLAIVNDTIYLFGGNDGYSAVKTIFSAPLFDPTTWTNHGSLLPSPLSDSQLVVVGDSIYLIGGKSLNETIVGNIYQAHVNDPLYWTDTLVTLPNPLCGSNISFIENKIYLFGGIDQNRNPTKNIYVADETDPTIWSFLNYLPYPVSGGQFVRIGNRGYLFTSASIPDFPRSKGTRILTCKTENPEQWSETNVFIPGEIYNSQVAILYDRIYLFGGSGSSVIFASDCELKYDLDYHVVLEYGSITRTLFQSAITQSELFKALGFPYWKTDYKSNL